MTLVVSGEASDEGTDVLRVSWCLRLYIRCRPAMAMGHGAAWCEADPSSIQ